MAFRTTVTEIQAGNAKEKRRYFIPDEEQPLEIDKQQKMCTIHFVYRHLTYKDMIAYGLKTWTKKEKSTRFI
jgi:hypothetical protein